MWQYNMARPACNIFFVLSAQSTKAQTPYAKMYDVVLCMTCWIKDSLLAKRVNQYYINCKEQSA
jgi:hypothetical protein